MEAVTKPTKLADFLALPATQYSVENPDGWDPYQWALEWALDADGGALPRYSAQPFANWIHNAWDNFLGEDEENNGVTTRKILEGAVSDWCGGRSF